MPDTVCFTVPLPWVDVTDHVPGAPSVRLPVYACVELANSVESLRSSQAWNQSNWHSFIACESDIATINANIDIKSLVYFIIFAPFLLSAAWQTKTARDYGGWSLKTI
jgi:hypothetical protein